MQSTPDLRRLIVADAMHAGNLADLATSTVTREDTLEHAAGTMAGRRVAHLVVVDDGRPVGVVSTLDIARAIAGADGIPPASGTARWRPPTAAHPSLTAATPTPGGSGGSDSRTRPLRETKPRR